MHSQIGKLVVVEPCTSHPCIVDGKAQRLDQVKSASRVGAEPDDVAGVGRYLWMNQDDVEHGASGLGSRWHWLARVMRRSGDRRPRNALGWNVVVDRDSACGSRPRW